MNTFPLAASGIPHCQILVNGQPCNALLHLTADSRYLICLNCDSKLIPVDSDRANLVRQAYRDRDNPSQALLNRRWKEALPVAVKTGTFTRTAYSRDKMADVKERVAVYKVAETMYEVAKPATQSTKTVGREIVACAVSKSGRKSAKLFAPISLTGEQIANMERQDRLIATMQTALDVKDEKLFRLREYVEPDCRCPCCDTSMFCLDGCTLQTDEPGWCSRMMRARYAMWGR